MASPVNMLNFVSGRTARFVEDTGESEGTVHIRDICSIQFSAVIDSHCLSYETAKVSSIGDTWNVICRSCTIQSQLL